MKSNIEVRKAISETSHPQWAIAMKLGISESVFSRMLRIELSKKDKEKLINDIRNIKW